MEATLNALGGILLKAIPTLILLTLLYLYLKSMFFTPLQDVLKRRREATSGAREAAEASLKRASDRAGEYQSKLQDARAGIYREHEELRRQFLSEQSNQLDAARAKTHELVKTARVQLEQELEEGKGTLQTKAEELADQIASTLLSRRPQ
jgi:F-type H+-transporting ATPase subunit b